MIESLLIKVLTKIALVLSVSLLTAFCVALVVNGCKSQTSLQNEKASLRNSSVQEQVLKVQENALQSSQKSRNDGSSLNIVNS